MRSGRARSLAAVLWVAAAPAARAGVSLTGHEEQEHGRRRAIVIGIDRYAPAAGRKAEAGSRKLADLQDLRGAVADARSFRDWLVEAGKVEAEDVVLLLDSEATRARILDELRQVIVEPARPGDGGTLYFAGSGSLVANGRAPGGFERSLVPADAAAGAPDVRLSESSSGKRRSAGCSPR